MNEPKFYPQVQILHRCVVFALWTEPTKASKRHCGDKGHKKVRARGMGWNKMFKIYYTFQFEFFLIINSISIFYFFHFLNNSF
jgi:hypothetical protein